MWFDFGFDTSHDMEFGKMSKAAHSTLQSSLAFLMGFVRAKFGSINDIL